MIGDDSGNCSAIEFIERLTRLATEVSNMPKEKQPWRIGILLQSERPLAE
jgi:hypothetical protein